MLKMGVIAIGAVLLSLLVKQQKPEYSFFIQITCCLIMFFYVLFRMKDVFSFLASFSNYVKIESQYIESIMKMIGITYVAEFAASICKDAGYTSIATQIQVAAKLSILILSMPVLYGFIATVSEFLK